MSLRYGEPAFIAWGDEDVSSPALQAKLEAELAKLVGFRIDAQGRYAGALDKPAKLVLLSEVPEVWMAWAQRWIGLALAAGGSIEREEVDRGRRGQADAEAPLRAPRRAGRDARARAADVCRYARRSWRSRDAGGRIRGDRRAWAG
ncbi:MAG: hypothetical protein HC927_07730 [Deltaproteobacteria bacterium]|nr:hypothetical protein [Deltaproteobacteria bacterium]